MVSLFTEDINEYLKYDEVIDFDKPEVKAIADTLFDEVSSETDFVRHAFNSISGYASTREETVRMLMRSSQ